MTEPTSGTPDLQFDRAEPSQPAADAAAPGPIQCAACGSRLLSYYSVNGRVTCKRCRDEAVAAQQGSHLPTLLRAAALGLLAAIAGAVVYFTVAKVTGYEIGLVSIVVGLLVGKAVKVGARARGGWRYQALAVLLCYLSIAASYFAFAVGEWMGQREKAAATATAPAPPDALPAAAPPAGAPRPEPRPAAAATAEPPAQGEPAAAPEAGAEPEAPAPSGLAVAGLLLLLLVQLPVLIGKESPMTFVLIAIALWEAWKLNVAAPFEASGPYAVGGEPAANG